MLAFHSGHASERSPRPILTVGVKPTAVGMGRPLLFALLCLLPSMSDCVVLGIRSATTVQLTTLPACGDGHCDAWLGRLAETCGSCPDDCGPCQSSNPIVSCLEPGVAVFSFFGGLNDATPDLLAQLSASQTPGSFFIPAPNDTYDTSLLKSVISSGQSTVLLLDSDTVIDAQSLQASLSRKSCRQPMLYAFDEESVLAVNGTDQLSQLGLREVQWSVRLPAVTPENNLSDALSSSIDSISTLRSDSVVIMQRIVTQDDVTLTVDLIASLSALGYTPVSLERCAWGPAYTSHPSWVFAHRSCGVGDDPQSVWPIESANACLVSDWSAWSPCDSPCGVGSQIRVRPTLPPSLRNTSVCQGLETIQQRECNVSVCPMNCAFTEWSYWGTAHCSAPCGVMGTATQYRWLSSMAIGDESTPADIAAIDAIPVGCGPVTRTLLCAGVCPVPASLETLIIGCSGLGVVLLIAGVAGKFLMAKLRSQRNNITGALKLSTAGSLANSVEETASYPLNDQQAASGKGDKPTTTRTLSSSNARSHGEPVGLSSDSSDVESDGSRSSGAVGSHRRGLTVTVRAETPRRQQYRRYKVKHNRQPMFPQLLTRSSSSHSTNSVASASDLKCVIEAAAGARVEGHALMRQPSSAQVWVVSPQPMIGRPLRSTASFRLANALP